MEQMEGQHRRIQDRRLLSHNSAATPHLARGRFRDPADHRPYTAMESEDVLTELPSRFARPYQAESSRAPQPVTPKQLFTPKAPIPNVMTLSDEEIVMQTSRLQALLDKKQLLSKLPDKGAQVHAKLECLRSEALRRVEVPAPYASVRSLVRPVEERFGGQAPATNDNHNDAAFDKSQKSVEPTKRPGALGAEADCRPDTEPTPPRSGEAFTDEDIETMLVKAMRRMDIGSNEKIKRQLLYEVSPPARMPPPAAAQAEGHDDPTVSRFSLLMRKRPSTRMIPIAESIKLEQAYHLREQQRMAERATEALSRRLANANLSGTKVENISDIPVDVKDPMGYRNNNNDDDDDDDDTDVDVSESEVQDD